MLTSDRLLDARRLDALRLSGLLDRPASDRMRHLVFTATALLGADAAELNLLDSTLQHHHASYPHTAGIADPVEESGCVLVVRADHLVSIPDTTRSPAVCDMAWTADWRGYMGAPVRYASEAVGSLCVLEHRPRAWTHGDRMTLTSLADLASTLITVERAA